jgi:hypothetical protein
MPPTVLLMQEYQDDMSYENACVSRSNQYGSSYHRPPLIKPRRGASAMRAQPKLWAQKGPGRVCSPWPVEDGTYRQTWAPCPPC